MSTPTHPPTPPRAPDAPGERVAGIVLAAGASSRMGGPNKLLLPVEGRPMVRLVVGRVLEAGAWPVLVVTGRDAPDVRDACSGLPVRFVHNDAFTGPTSGSLHAGLAALGDDTDAALVMLADMPRVGVDMLRDVVHAVRRRDVPLAVSRYGDVLAPPLAFRRALWPELLAWHGEGCGKAVVRAHEHEATMLDRPMAALQDVDTPDDYASLAG